MFSSIVGGEGRKSEKTKKKVTLPVPITVAVYHTQHALGLIQENTNGNPH